jgi:phenylacetate-CoA ligase
LPTPHSGTEGIAWPALAGGMAPLLLATNQQLDRTQYLPPAALRERQFRQLEQLLGHAARHMPFYAPALRACGWQPGRTLTEAHWAALPLLTRVAVQQAGPALHSDAVPAAHGKIDHESTSGSTGVPIEVRRTALGAFFWSAFTLREEIWHGRDLAAKFAAIRRDGRRPPGAAGLFATQFDNWGPPVATVYPTGPAALLDVRCPIADQVAWLVQQAPAYLLSHAVNLHFLARHCREYGIRLPSLRGLRSSGEVLSEAARLDCREAWGLDPVDMYSAVETGYLALQCPEHGQLHVQAENALVEVLDGNQRPCRPGEVGRVVVTPLHNFAMPLLRYELGDLAEVGPPCPCGRTLPVLRRVLGRTRDMLILPSGERRLYYVGKATAAFPGIIQHQLVQTNRQRIEFRMVARRPLTAAEEQRLRDTVLSEIGHGFRLEFVYVDEIERTASGKYLEFRCDVAKADGS